MKNNEMKLYMARCMKHSAEELIALKRYISSRRGSMRYGELMLNCVCAALLAKVGMN